LEALKASAAEERIRLAAETVYQALIDAEATAVIGAGPWERSESRTAPRVSQAADFCRTASTAGDLGEDGGRAEAREDLIRAAFIWFPE
jgi:hypothetical protein